MLTSDIFEESVLTQSRFSMPTLRRNVEQHEPFASAIPIIEHFFNKREKDKLIEGIIRFAFLIQPVKYEINTTLYTVRWDDYSNCFFDFSFPNDPRSASFQECKEIAQYLLEQLNILIFNEAIRNTIKKALQNPSYAHDLPIDYIDDDNSRIGFRLHIATNIEWQLNQSIRNDFQLSLFLLQDTGSYTQFFKQVRHKKIETKTYLTDRAQTGPHQTNREYRWEANPDSVQFALRRTCWNIEFTLLHQLLRFDGTPEEIWNKAVELNLVSNNSQLARCPVTMEPLSFARLKAEIDSPVHGHSEFQVGHLDPLKATSRYEHEAGHSPNNISWITRDGNRIQGSYSLEETRNLLRRIRENEEYVCNTNNDLFD